MADDQGYECTEMEIQLGVDGVFGVTLGMGLAVTDVKRGTPAYGRFRVGDRIITVSHFFFSIYNYPLFRLTLSW